MEKLLCVTDSYGILLGANTVVFLGEAESSIEFEQVFECMVILACIGLLRPLLVPLHRIDDE